MRWPIDVSSCMTARAIAKGCAANPDSHCWIDHTRNNDPTTQNDTNQHRNSCVMLIRLLYRLSGCACMCVCISRSLAIIPAQDLYRTRTHTSERCECDFGASGFRRGRTTHIHAWPKSVLAAVWTTVVPSCQQHPNLYALLYRDSMLLPKVFLCGIGTIYDGMIYCFVETSTTPYWFRLISSQHLPITIQIATHK